jgi:hypothetical protein
MTDREIENLMMGIITYCCAPLLLSLHSPDITKNLIILLISLGNLALSYYFYIRWYSKPAKRNSLNILTLYLLIFSFSFFLMLASHRKYWKSLVTSDGPFS